MKTLITRTWKKKWGGRQKGGKKKGAKKQENK
jgi:hypothetical protein